MHEKLIPAKPLKPGDKILILAPAWMFGGDSAAERRQRIESMKAVILDMGFTPVVPDDLIPADGSSYCHDYAQSPEVRASHFIKYLQKGSDIKAIWCAEGGLGASETLDVVEKQLKETKDALLDHSIPVLGFSDITHLLLRLGRPNNGIIHPVTPIHSDLLSSLARRAKESTVDKEIEAATARIAEIRDILSGKTPLVEHHIISLNERARTVGRIEDCQVAGGYFERIDHSIGTKYQLGRDGKVIVIVEGAPPPEGEVDLRSVIKHIKDAGNWDNIGGIVIGHMTLFSDRGKPLPETFYSLEARAYIDTIAAENSDKPFFGGLNIGHAAGSAVIPLGTASTIIVGSDGRATLTASTTRTEKDFRARAMEEKSGDKETKAPDTLPPLEEFADLTNVKLTQITTGASKRSRVLKDVEVVGGDAQKVILGAGTQNQIDVKGKVLFLDFNLNAGQYGENFARGAIIRVLTRLKNSGMLRDAAALVVGNIAFTPRETNKPSQRFIADIDSRLATWMRDNGFDDLPVYTAKGHDKLPERFYNESATLKCMELGIMGMDALDLATFVVSDDVRRTAVSKTKETHASRLGGSGAQGTLAPLQHGAPGHFISRFGNKSGSGMGSVQ